MRISSWRLSPGSATRRSMANFVTRPVKTAFDLASSLDTGGSSSHEHAMTERHATIAASNENARCIVLPNVKDEPRSGLARLVLLGARDVTALTVGSGAL